MPLIGRAMGDWISSHKYGFPVKVQQVRTIGAECGGSPESVCDDQPRAVNIDPTQCSSVEN
ncbi:hypothetical protein HETIRDRAFT_416354 [Heterobasidion irregulare TC 32-1]|uniref:Uncharacterized protein n=1 Tax=Heterobasidion irregulare (strain TC 32-1) TaxID=747525 RepID=W4KG27_HETIT|nr:uncharacterized protein HETIRDRAFT_416354 [Heterobasidion irregulare TC 32-1]ETW84689.1 hypothetical protein HETIRDRAFT_416354 [Heterobasidion irregulare TC 32-1]